MKEELLVFSFFGILLALAFHLLVDKIYRWLFPNAFALQAHWYIPYVAAPVLLLAAFAFLLGFYRRGGRRWADLAATLILAAIVFLTVGAPYSCWHFCF